jgi:glutamate carboxypeptidase
VELNALETRVCEAIEARREALLEDLRLEVETPTGGFNMPAIDRTRARFVGRLEALGATTEMVPGDPKPDWLPGANAERPVPPVAICRRKREGLRPVLIAGHLDTVHDPAGPFCSLTIAPDGKTATGPGCVDMKGGLVIALAALEALEEVGAPASWGFLMNADEETGSFHSARAIAEESAGYACGLALEPAMAGGELAIERSGSGQFMIECRGRAAHVGRSFTEGVSAVTALGERIVRVAEMPDPERGRILSIGPIEGGVATNAVPDRARAWGNARYPTPEAADEIETMLRTLETPADAMPSVRVHTCFNRPAKPLIPATERLALAARGVAEALGQRLPFASTGGVCDGNIMQAAGLPTIDTLGVRGGGLHTPDEWIDLSSLVERCQLLGVLIARLSAPGAE